MLALPQFKGVACMITKANVALLEEGMAITYREFALGSNIHKLELLQNSFPIMSLSAIVAFSAEAGTLTHRQEITIEHAHTGAQVCPPHLPQPSP